MSTKYVSEIGFYLRPQVKPTQLGPIDRASPYLWTMDNVQEYNICTNLPSSQTLRSYQPFVFMPKFMATCNQAVIVTGCYKKIYKIECDGKELEVGLLKKTILEQA
jgi:hypothetical protein